MEPRIGGRCSPGVNAGVGEGVGAGAGAGAGVGVGVGAPVRVSGAAGGSTLARSEERPR